MSVQRIPLARGRHVDGRYRTPRPGPMFKFDGGYWVPIDHIIVDEETVVSAGNLAEDVGLFVGTATAGGALTR